MQRELVKTTISEVSAMKKDQRSTKRSRRRRSPERASSKLGRRLSPRSRARGQFRYCNNHLVIHLDSRQVYTKNMNPAHGHLHNFRPFKKSTVEVRNGGNVFPAHA